MKKINIIKNNRDFDRIIKNNKPFKYKNYIIYVEKVDTNIHRFGLSVGKKIGNAVIRNKIKRQLKAIIDEKDYQNNFNCIIIVGRGINDCDYNTKKENLHFALKKLNLLKENMDEKK